MKKLILALLVLHVLALVTGMLLSQSLTEGDTQYRNMDAQKVIVGLDGFVDQVILQKEGGGEHAIIQFTKSTDVMQVYHFGTAGEVAVGRNPKVVVISFTQSGITFNRTVTMVGFTGNGGGVFGLDGTEEIYIGGNPSHEDLVVLALTDSGSDIITKFDRSNDRINWQIWTPDNCSSGGGEACITDADCTFFGSGTCSGTTDMQAMNMRPVGDMGVHLALDDGFQADWIKLTPTSSPPATCDSTWEGVTYYDSDINMKCTCNGTNWVQNDLFITVCS